MDSNSNKKNFHINNRGTGQRGYKGAGFIALILLFVLIIYAAYGQTNTLQEVSLSTAVQQTNSGQYSKILVSGNELLITKKGDDQPTIKSYMDPNGTLKDEGFNQSKVDITYKPESSTGSTLAVIGETLLPVGVVALLFFFMLRSAQGQGNQALSFRQKPSTSHMGMRKIRLLLVISQAPTKPSKILKKSWNS